MLSKYILPSNFVSLSSNYRFDDTVSFNNLLLPVAGNLSVYYSSNVEGVVDYSNNNYSNFILTNSRPIDSLISKKVPNIDLNKSACVIAINLVDGVVSDETRFLRYNTNLIPTANTVLQLDRNNYFEVIFLTDIEAIVKKDMGDYFVYMAVDDSSNLVVYLTATEEYEKSFYETQKIKFSYTLDKDKLILYKIVQEDIFYVSILDSYVEMKPGTFDDIPTVGILNYIKIGSLKVDQYSIDHVKYKTGIDKNNLDISREKSTYNIHNNFLNHFQYNTIKENRFDTNFFALKSHFNVTDDVTNIESMSGYRKYTSIFTGGDQEKGSQDISLGYKSNYFTLELDPDKTTWFHLPYDESQAPIKINDTKFVESGAVAGSSPAFSDKIWKRIANYTYTSNQRSTTGDEQTGRWLCSWLSAGPYNNYIWVDRFYNPDIFSPYQALKYPSNVDYTPQYEGKRKEGISDITSELTLESGVWYAYSHFGKKTAQTILSGIDFLEKTKLDSFKTINGIDVLPEIDTDGEEKYTFTGKEIGKFSSSLDLKYNNFSISFFATRNNWNKTNLYSMLGNYVDRGFSLINNNKFNPYIFYYNEKILYVFNGGLNQILKIDLDVYLPNQNFEIKGLFIRDVNENFHIVTSNYELLEFNCTGTLIDKKNFSNLIVGNQTILSYANNTNYGVIKTSFNDFFKFDLLTNTIEQDLSFLTIDSPNVAAKVAIIIDSYGKIYTMPGTNPIIKGTFLYYIDSIGDSIKVYNTSNDVVDTYLQATSGKIVSYTFNEKDETLILYNNFIEVYDELGAYKDKIEISTDVKNISCCNITFQDLCNENYQTLVHFIDSDNNNYLYNVEKNLYSLIDSNYNNTYNSLSASIFYKNTRDLTNYNYIQSVINNIYPLPSYNFKIKLLNQLNSEDLRYLNTTVLGELLDVGTHHFCIVLDTLEGYYNIYIDGQLYSSKIFPAKKYSLLNIFSNSFTLGSVPFFNNVDFFDFYKKDILKCADDLTIEKFKFYENTLNAEEVKLLYYEKFPPKQIKVNIKTGERNFIETITRTFRHKLQGSKSNLINLYINNSLMIDRDVQQMYNSIIIKELTPYLPSNVRINNIVWFDVVNSIDKMVIGDYSIKNTLTDTQDLIL